MSLIRDSDGDWIDLSESSSNDMLWLITAENSFRFDKEDALALGQAIIDMANQLK